MIIGCKYWDDRDRFYTQENNSTEELLKKLGFKNYLETCGSSMVTNCCMSIEGTSYKFEELRIQPEDLVTALLNNSHNYGELQKYRPNLDPSEYPGNRIPQYHPYAAEHIFGIKAEYLEMNGFNSDFVKSKLEIGCSIGACYKKPGHFISIVAYDATTDEFITKDSWRSTIKDGTNGFLRRIPKNWIKTNIQNYCIVFYPNKGN